MLPKREVVKPERGCRAGGMVIWPEGWVVWRFYLRFGERIDRAVEWLMLWTGLSEAEEGELLELSWRRVIESRSRTEKSCGYSISRSWSLGCGAWKSGRGCTLREHV